MNRNYKRIAGVAMFSVIGVGAFLSGGHLATAAGPTCTFSRDLQLGSMGEDVRCLQQYLNANGYIISTTGAGSVGKETTEFKSLTQAAVAKWQLANKLSPASGYFGPQSRQVYTTLAAGGSVTTPITSAGGGTVSAQDALLKQIAEIQKQLAEKTQTTTTPVASSVATQLKKVTTALKDAEDEVADNDDADEYDDAVDSLIEARDDFYTAILAYLRGDATKASAALDDVEDSIEDALDYIDSDRKGDIEDDLEDARDELDRVRDDVDEADDDGEDMDDAYDYLDEAEDLLDDAEDALDDDDEDEAEDLIDEARGLIKDAKKEL